jgi:hypothetical protein
MPLPRLLVALVAASAWACGGCSGDDEPPSDGASPAAQTSLADLDLAGLAARRAAFCDAVPDAAVDDALSGPARRSTTWADGEPAGLTDEVRDVAHEFGCRYRGRDGTTAEAWVFAPPVDRATARALVREASAARGCDPVADAPAMGAPSVALSCDSSDEASASHRGLLGDGWLVCRVITGSPAPEDLADRTDRWCAAVATAATR